MNQTKPPSRRADASQGDDGKGIRITAATIETQKGGGAISGLARQLEHNPFAGSAAFDIPIPTPAPRGVSPGLALKYASASGNGVFGLGFDIGTAKMTRRSASFGIPRYDDTDLFSHSEQGTLVEKLTPQGTVEQRYEPEAAPIWRVRAYLPRVEGSFARIENWQRLSDGTSHWLIRTNANETLLYGVSAQARISDPAAPARTAEWLLEETKDAHGNKVRYSYSAADRAPERELTSNRYLAEVAFGNFTQGGEDRFNVRVVLDYGGHEGDTPGPEPTRPPLPRPDPFSAYVTGFEVRTIWRCRRVLVYATHPELFDCAPVLTRALTLVYEQGATGLSLLSRVEQRGFRKGKDGSYAHEDLPPLSLGFTPFDPEGQSYAELIVENGGTIPGSVGEGLYLPVDLDGEGLPGILYSALGQTLYWPPLGEGRYGAPVAPARFPSFRDLGDQTLTLASLEANGRQDLVSLRPGCAGYFSLEISARAEPVATATDWAAFRPFESIPSGCGSDAGTLVSLNGDGRLDFLETQAPTLRCYPSLGTRGFGTPDVALMRETFPPSPLGDATQVDTYADMFGDGLSHRVRVSQGRVECWPDLGYGVFGAKVSLANAPRYGDALAASRLFLADLDGSGPADLIYATADALLIYFNQSGNGFADALTLPLPAPFDSTSRISFADVYGTGASCLVFTRLEPEVTHFVYAFSGRTKPYLLATLDDAMGRETRCTYTTSVQEYLRDKRDGRTWITQTYFPVQVVAEIETIDQIARARNVQRFAYHDGYYDPVQKQFQGFGYVESWDSETFEDRASAIRAGATRLDSLSRSLFSPVAYTRTWFHTGAFVEAEAIVRQSRAEFWQGDPDAPVLPRQWMAPDIEAADEKTLRQAYSALAGRLIRSEVYGLDGAPEASMPYSVSQASAGVRLIQPKGPNRRAVVQPFAREQLGAQYERDPADPRIDHDVLLAQDAYGNVTRSCTINYPRRPGPALGPYPYPEQETIRVVAREYAYVVHPGDASAPDRWIGQQIEERAYELAGVTPNGRYFTFAALAGQCSEALAHTIPYGRPFSTGLREARLFLWTRGYYWNADQTASLPLGEIAPLGLVHHGESAVMTPELVRDAFGASVSQSQITAAGYALDQDYWWDRGLIQYYETRSGGYWQPCRTDGSFDGVPEDSSLNPTTLTTYDVPALCITSVSRVGSATALGADGVKQVVLTSTVATDHQTSEPASITDPNGSTTQFEYSPLGMVIATAIVGTIDGKPAGDLPLDTRIATPAPTIAEIVAEPQTFLQGSSSYFHYDLWAWSSRRQPVALVEVTRQLHVHQLAEGETTLLPITVTYRDGSWRELESRLDCGIEATTGTTRRRWAVSGRVRLDNKGQPVETYLPFYAGSPSYADDVPLEGALPPPDVTRYDALGRVVLEITSKGFLRRESFAAWMSTAWDENDTVLDSPFYKSFPTDPTTPAQKREAAALAQAVHAYNTPMRTCVDPAGGTIRVLVANLGAITPATLAPAVVGQPITSQELWDRLVADGYLKPAAEIPGAAWATARLQPYVSRFRQAFSDAYGALAAPTLEILKETGLTTLNVLDVESRVTRTTDPRLLYGALSGGGEAANFIFLLDMAGLALCTQSADAGPGLAVSDVFGNAILSIDGRGIETITRYDRFARPVEVDATAPEPGGTITRRAELFVYGELHADPTSRNLNGRLWQSFDDAGLETTDLYDLAGDALTTGRRLRLDYTQPANWTAAAIAAIEQEDALVTTYAFDAEQARISERAPDGSVTRFGYNLAGQIVRVTVEGSGEASPRTIVDRAAYAAFGARLRIGYGNGVVTDATYEHDTQRLASVISTNAAGETLQDVVYTYDPVSNVTEKLDQSWKTVFCYNQQVDAASTYTYDPLYRLVRGTGRQRGGTSADVGGDNVMPFCPPNPADRAHLENYTEDFLYDDAGNMIRLRHSAAGGSWTTELPVDEHSNRLVGKPYDPAGNQLLLAGPLRWDFRNWLSAATLVSRPSGDDDSEHYLYDASGVRLLRVTRRLKQAATDDLPALYEISETLFLGNYERTRTLQERRDASAISLGATPLTTVEALTVPDDEGHFAVLERDTTRARTRRAASDGRWQGRFLITDQVASVTQETDDTGARITYREYSPYGATAFVASDSEADAAPSKFRFAGKRHDDATGLYYFGLRYYPPWLARWISTDPAGDIDGLNLYAYVEGNPTSFTDPTGLGKTNDVLMHGKKVRKPDTHATMHKQSESLGKQVAQEIVASTTDNTARLKTMEKDIANIQIKAGLPVHDESKVDEALKAGMAGNKARFDQLYRAALPGMDEQISTATMYYIAKGAGQVTMDKAQWKQFAYSFRIASRLRLETEYSGYATKHGEVQHPTSKGSEFFSSSGKGHTYWDRARREDVVKFGGATASTGVDRMLGMIGEAGRHSLSYGVAPSRARNITSRSGVRKRDLRRQMRHREALKRIVLRVQGVDLTTYATQKRHARWRPSRTAPPSPLRVGYY